MHSFNHVRNPAGDAPNDRTATRYPPAGSAATPRRARKTGRFRRPQTRAVCRFSYEITDRTVHEVGGPPGGGAGERPGTARMFHPEPAKRRRTLIGRPAPLEKPERDTGLSRSNRNSPNSPRPPRVVRRSLALSTTITPPKVWAVAGHPAEPGASDAVSNPWDPSETMVTVGAFRAL